MSENVKLSFKSKKNNGIILSEKQLIDQYLKQKPNTTIQEFIKHNFVIGKEESKKEQAKNELKSKRNAIEVKPKEFVKALSEAIESMPPELRWRVTQKSEKECENLKCYKTNGGSVFAITEDGDIEAVCKNSSDKLKGKDLIKEAVKLGGRKLDSFDGNNLFYQKFGFKPVSWCKWDDEFKPELWSEKFAKKENIIFYRYDQDYKDLITENDFYKEVEVSKDYGDAQSKRDKEL